MDNEEARDAICGIFKTAWDAGTPAIMNAFGYGSVVPDVDWPNVRPNPDDTPLHRGNKPWARVRLRHTTGWQHSLGAAPNRLFTHYGFVAVQVFVPAGKRGLVLADRLGKVALEAFEGEATEDGVWFKNASLSEQGVVDTVWYQINVGSEFRYDKVK